MVEKVRVEPTPMTAGKKRFSERPSPETGLKEGENPAQVRRSPNREQEAPTVEGHGGEGRVWQRRACGADE